MPKISPSTTHMLMYLVVVMVVLAPWPRPVEAKIVDRIVAIINDDCITLTELKEKAQKILAQTNQPKRPLDEALLAQLLPQVIDQYLIENEVKKRGIKVSEQEIDMAISDILSSNGITLEELKDLLKKQGKDLKDYREEIRTQIEHSRLISQEVRGQIVVTDDEIKEYLKQNPEMHRVNSPIYVLQDIFIGFGNGISKDEAEATAKKIYEQLKKTGEVSDGRYKFQDLGSITLSEMAPFLRSHVEKLNKGEISDIITTDQGFHIVRVKDIIRSDADSLKAKKAEIRRKLVREKLNSRFEEWLKELRRNASIRILL